MTNQTSTNLIYGRNSIYRNLKRKMSKKVKGFLGNGPAPKTAKPNFNASMFVGGINSIIEEEEL